MKKKKNYIYKKNMENYLYMSVLMSLCLLTF